MEKIVTFSYGADTLEGIFDLTSPEIKNVNTLFLHGAGNATKERMGYLARGLVNRGVSSFRFDFSGAGKSTGEMKDSSLKHRLEQAWAAVDFIKPNAPLTLVGSSMGGEIALRLLGHVYIADIVLFCPGIYHRDAYDMPFDDRFSRIIRQEESWKHAAVFDLLQNYTGKLTIHIGEQDPVIPRGVVDLLQQHAVKADFRLVTYPNVDHAIHTWLEQSDHVEAVIDKIAST